MRRFLFPYLPFLAPSISNRGFRTSTVVLSEKNGGGFSFPSPRTLNELVKLEAFEVKDSEEIKNVWIDFHKTKDDCIGSSLSEKEYKLLYDRAKECPYFVTPIPRGEGFFNVIWQFQEKYFLLTLLEEFKKDPSSSSPILTVSLFDELLASKGLTLLRGDIVNTLNKKESLSLLHTLLNSYIDPQLFSFVHTFNKTPEKFHFEEYHTFIKNSAGNNTNQ